MKKGQTYCTMYVVRHGETEWNVKGLIHGQKDSPLTQKGEEQAKLLGKKLKHIKFDAAFSSDLLRAKRTAQLITFEHDLAVETNKLLRERYFGKHEGIEIKKMEEELREEFKEFESLSDSEKFRFKILDIESDEEIVSRFRTFLREVSITFGGKKVLIVTHGGTIRTLLIHLRYATYRELSHGAISNAAYIKLESDGVDFFVKGTEGIHLKDI